MDKDLNSFIKFLDLDVKDLKNFKIALTHSSFVKENELENEQFNERLEFLGDAVLKICSSRYLFEKFPQYPEGKLSKIRSILVSDESLAKFALKIKLNEHLKLGKNEEKNDGRNRNSTLACAFEAMLGAIYLELGEKTVFDFLLKIYKDEVEKINNNIEKYNIKALLQEYTQEKNKNRPEYKVLKVDGEPHDPVFTCCVEYEGKILGYGTGKTKKNAEIEAAKQACIFLGLLENND